MLTTWISLALSITSLVFSAGVFWGKFLAERRRLRVRIRDLERAYSAVANRPFVSKYPEE